MPASPMPGNHDDHAAFSATFANHDYLPRGHPFHNVVDDRGPVKIIALDVTLPGLHHGAVDDAALVWLEAALAAIYQADQSFQPNRHYPRGLSLA